MKIPEATISLKSANEIDSKYAQCDAGACIEISSDGDSLSFSTDTPVGIKYMGMTVASVSKLKVSCEGEIVEREIEAPFLVKAQVEAEIRKAAKRIPFAEISEVMEAVGAVGGARIKIEAGADNSIRVDSTAPLSLGKSGPSLKSFTVNTSGQIVETGTSLDPTLWERFISIFS